MAKQDKKDCFKIKIWGTRGSIPTPGPDTLKYGGNTSCVEVRCGDEIIILDSGTGIRELGNSLLAEMPIRATILISHAHWDHIQGFPFFVPGFIYGNSFKIYGETRLEIERTLRSQMMYPTFPVTLDEMQASIQFENIRSAGYIEVGDVYIKYDKLNHPGGVTTFRIHYKDKSMLYATDTEHFRCLDSHLLGLAKDVDLLIYDAQYTPEEYSGAKGMPKTSWGHSTWEAGVEMAEAANIKQLLLFHHDPLHTDKMIDEIEMQAQQVFKSTLAAFEGMEIFIA